MISGYVNIPILGELMKQALFEGKTLGNIPGIWDKISAYPKNKIAISKFEGSSSEIGYVESTVVFAYMGTKNSDEVVASFTAFIASNSWLINIYNDDNYVIAIDEVGGVGG